MRDKTIKRRSRDVRTKVKKTLLYCAMIIIICLIFAPFSWLIISSVSTMNELLSVPPHWIPHNPTFENYAKIVLPRTGGSEASEMFRYTMWNSFLVALSVTTICLILGSISAYAFARFDFPLKNSAHMMIIAIRMLPALSTIIPLYIFIRKVGLIDTKTALVVLYTTFTLPFVIWIMTGFFRTIPTELEEAARIDGCSRLGALYRIVLPLSTPGLVATGIFSFMLAWDEFFFALIFTSTYNAKTVPVAIAEFTGRHVVDYSMMCTGGVLASIPPVLLALIFQRHIIQGLTAGAVKR